MEEEQVTDLTEDEYGIFEDMHISGEWVDCTPTSPLTKASE